MTMTDREHNIVLAAGKFDVVGTRPIRHDGADKVTGRALYGGDYQTAGLLHGGIMRSVHAHARILSIDVSKAEALPGVRAVVTAKDLPDVDPGVTVNYGEGDMRLDYLKRNVLADDKVLYVGHAIAGVAAISLHIAEEALGLIEVEYEPLPTVMTAPQGLQKGATILIDDLRTEEFGQRRAEPSNTAQHFQHRIGDVEKGFQTANVVVEQEFNTQSVHQGYIEPQNVTALWNNDGRVHIWTSTQGPFEVRGAVAAVLDIPVSHVRVTPMEIGGGFGGKFPLYLDPVAVLLSRKTGHPVKMVMTRKEVFEGTGPTPGSYIRVKIGATNQGKIVAAEAYLAYEAGAFPGSPVDAGAECVFAAYDIPNAVIDGYDVVVNKPKSAAYTARPAPPTLRSPRRPSSTSWPPPSVSTPSSFD